MLRRSDPPPESSREQTDQPDHPVRSLIVIGASAGGRAAISRVLKDLSHDIPAAIIVMLHVAPDSTFDLSKWFQQFGHITIVEASQYERLREGTVFVAPPGHSVSVHEEHVKLDALESTGKPRETIDRLFESAAKAYGKEVIGVILSGRLADGAHGLGAVQAAGGLTVIQNPEEAEYEGMPVHASAQVPDANFTLHGADIGLTLDLLARRNAELETGVASAVRLLKERIALLVKLLGQSTRNKETYDYLSTELQSLRGELRAVEKLLPAPP